jgi:hypothetical protein
MIYLIRKILWALKMAPKDKELQEIYSRVFADALVYMNKFPTQMVAATYIAIAMRLYKTTLDENEYEEMIKTIMDSEVEPYTEPNETKH